MIVQDHTRALLSYLEDEYQEQEQQLLRVAREEAATIIKAQEERAHVVAERRKKRDVKAIRQRIHAATATASYAAKQERDACKESYLNEGLELVKQQLHNSSKKQKEQLVKKMLEELKTTIKEEGYDPQTFTYAVWQEVRIAGTKNLLPYMGVKASKDYISFEDSVIQRLEERESLLKQALLKNM